MKPVLRCMIVFMTVMFVFGCSGEKSFEKSENFESGKFSDTLFGPGGGGGQIVSDPEKVISGKFSAYGKGDPSKSVWCEFLYSDSKKLVLERKESYFVTFNYKAVEAPGADGYYYFLARTPVGGIANDKGFTTWSTTAGDVGTKTIEITLGDFDNYYLIWGVRGEGAMAIDDIKIVKRKKS